MSAKKKRAAARGGAAPQPATPATAKWWRHPLAPAGLLMLLVLVAYLPALAAGFIWDDDAYVTKNPMLTDPHGLREIWFTAHTQSQYFPLVYTTFRFEHELWGLNPFGFHLVNVLLHGVNVTLVWWVLRRLLVPGAWLAAAIFALHPVEVETVAWVTELKSIESLLFYLLAVLAWIEFVDSPGPPRWRFYALALAAYLPALFAKTTACTLPAALVLVPWLRGQRIGWPRAVQILPFVLIGIGMGLLTVWWEQHLGNYDENFGLAFTIPQRMLIAGRALWFYAGKLFWPANLAFSYPHWNINAADPVQYIPVLACLATAVALWVWREKIGSRVIAGIVFFVAALSPLLGFVREYTFMYTFVADHYQYTASIGLIAIGAGALCRWLGGTAYFGPVAAALLLILGGLTWHQCGAYRNLETIWRDTLSKNPDSWMAHHNLGIELFEHGQIDEALQQYQAAVALYPQGDLEQSDLGAALLEKERYPEAIEHLEKALTLNPKLQPAENNLALAYSDIGDYEQAAAHYRKALQIDPNAMGSLMNLGSVLKQQGNLEGAIECYRQGTEQFPKEVEPWRRLGEALMAKQEPARAAEAWQQAVRLAPDNSDLWLDLGNADVMETNYAGAADSFRNAVKLNPDTAGLHYNLGLVLGLQGNREAEKEELTKALQLKPDYREAMQQLLLLNMHRTN
jgi:tetratricopeptide (TPR) repeat protein